MLLIERRLARCGLSDTAARPGEAPKYIGVHTEASFEIPETARVAPTGASKRQAITTKIGNTDARNDEHGRH